MKGYSEFSILVAWTLKEKDTKYFLKRKQSTYYVISVAQTALGLNKQKVSIIFFKTHKRQQ